MDRTFVIAEAGVNHNGSLGMALELVDVAATAGADAIKFQTFQADKLVSIAAEKAGYQKASTGNSESQLEMLQKLQLGIVEHKAIMERCRQKKIQFISTPFDFDSVALLDELDIPLIKIPSGEVTNAPMLLRIAQTNRNVILSTGMSSLADIELALGALAFGYLKYETTPMLSAFMEVFYSNQGQQLLQEKVTLLHCTTEYPVPYDEVNLKVMETLRLAFGLPVGLSDHTCGIGLAIAAVALGAKIIEKHFTLDKTLPGPDHSASLEPGELKALVKAIRQVEMAMGTSLKIPGASEIKNVSAARKSLVAAKDICKGEVFTEKNLTVKRPGNGISPISYWEYLGTAASCDYKEDEVILI